jgi:hypothetical protein
MKFRASPWLAAPALMLGLSLQCACAAVPSHIAAALPDAHLAGSGTYRWFGIRVYDAQLWVGPQGYQADAAPFALDLRYGHSFAGNKIAERSATEIDKLGIGSASQRSEWLKQMETCFPDVEDGTHLTGIFHPGAGAAFYRDGKPLCDIKDAQFATAFFAIWLDPHTSAPGLRTELLSQGKQP